MSININNEEFFTKIIHSYKIIPKREFLEVLNLAQVTQKLFFEVTDADKICSAVPSQIAELEQNFSKIQAWISEHPLPDEVDRSDYLRAISDMTSKIQRVKTHQEKLLVLQPLLENFLWK